MRLNGMGSQGFYDWIRINDLPGPIVTPPQSWTPPDFWWWFHASRVINTFDGVHFIDNTIQEFPFFSFLLGDMHPHVMSIPFIAAIRRHRAQHLPPPLELLAQLSQRLSLRHRTHGGACSRRPWLQQPLGHAHLRRPAHRHTRAQSVPRGQRHSTVCRACVLPRRTWQFSHSPP